MLEVRNLTKIYKPKKGVPVKALDGISLQFPETGMVFLLGKSGSGKSTLLNLLGGLDSHSGGEIIIAGTSSKSFRGGKLDSYRNTLVGFIFQEYNVLEEFTVGANVALALELQGKKATDKAINEILKKVDLAGYGGRRPNELSGGQKQRVAIARALVKNPKIIMADEPTGALDSVTGRQVLDTLKELSREKLVIVVSHDRDFALQYADRIIELADGRVISDLEYKEEEPAFSARGMTFGDGEITFSAGYRLTEEDREQINAYLAALEEGRTLSLRPYTRRERRAMAPTVSSHSFSPIQWIRSRLPLSPAFRIGVGALKHKKVRLAFTIFLSCIAFGLFGLSDTFGSYDHIRTCTQSILDSEIGYASFSRSEKIWYGDDEDEYYIESNTRISQAELEEIEDQTGLDLTGVYRSPDAYEISFGENTKLNPYENGQFSFYSTSFYGFAEVGKSDLREQGLTLLAGRLPDGDKNELAISEYLFESFLEGDYLPSTNEAKTVKIRKYEDLLGKTLVLDGTSYTVVGIVSAGFDMDRYRFLSEKMDESGTADMILSFAMQAELSSIRCFSLAGAAMVGKGHIQSIAGKEGPYRVPKNTELHLRNDDAMSFIERITFFSSVKKDGILWTNEEKMSLEKHEVLISSDLLRELHIEGVGFDTDFYSLSEGEQKRVLNFLGEKEFEVFSFSHYGREAESTSFKVRIVGVLPKEINGNRLAGSEALLSPYITSLDGLYAFAVGPMPENFDAVKRVVQFSDQEGDVLFPLENSVTYELSAIHSLLQMLSTVFFWIGVGFALFASLMLANFIGTSIAYKKQQIGILRAIGARSGDVFRIFFAESFVIAMINFVLSAGGTFAIVTWVNALLRSETGLLITILHFTLRQVILLFGVSLLVAALASFFPVKKIAAKKPIDAIRGK